MTIKLENWREALRDQMWQAAHSEAQRDAAPMEAFAFYRWEHVLAVVRTAILLAEQQGADPEIAEAAAWLHDVRKEKGAEHGQAGADFARSFLPSTDFPASKIEPVAIAIENHIGLWRDTPLEDPDSQILWDADKLTKLGLEGGLHFVLGEANKQAPLRQRMSFGALRPQERGERELSRACTQLPHNGSRASDSRHSTPCSKRSNLRFRSARKISARRAS